MYLRQPCVYAGASDEVLAEIYDLVQLDSAASEKEILGHLRRRLVHGHNVVRDTAVPVQANSNGREANPIRNKLPHYVEYKHWSTSRTQIFCHEIHNYIYPGFHCSFNHHSKSRIESC